MSLLGNIGGAIGGVGDRISGLFRPRSSSEVGKAIPAAGGYMNHMQQIKDIEGSLKKGGPIHKTGIYKLHKGERVLNTKQVKKLALQKKINK